MFPGNLPTAQLFNECYRRKNYQCFTLSLLNIKTIYYKTTITHSETYSPRGSPPMRITLQEVRSQQGSALPEDRLLPGSLSARITRYEAHYPRRPVSKRIAFSKDCSPQESLPRRNGHPTATRPSEALEKLQSSLQKSASPQLPVGFALCKSELYWPPSPTIHLRLALATPG